MLIFLVIGRLFLFLLFYLGHSCFGQEKENTCFGFGTMVPGWAWLMGLVGVDFNCLQWPHSVTVHFTEVTHTAAARSH